jgi:predicted small secreted protein
MLRTIILSAVILATAYLVAGCNTIAGLGEDITGSARSVQRAL